MSNTLIYHTGCSISRPDWGCPSKARSLLALWKVWLRLRLSQLRLSQLRLWLLWQEGSCWTWTWTWNWTWRRRWQLRSWFWIWWPLSWIYWKQDPEVVIVFVLVFFYTFDKCSFKNTVKFIWHKSWILWSYPCIALEFLRQLSRWCRALGAGLWTLCQNCACPSRWPLTVQTEELPFPEKKLFYKFSSL